MSKAKNVKEVLTAAEWMLENIGWSRWLPYADETGQFITRNCVLSGSHKLGSMCLLGALRLVDTDDDTYEAARVQVEEHIPFDIGIVAFNDQEGQTKGGVLKLLRKAKKNA